MKLFFESPILGHSFSIVYFLLTKILPKKYRDPDSINTNTSLRKIFNDSASTFRLTCCSIANESISIKGCMKFSHMPTYNPKHIENIIKIIPRAFFSLHRFSIFSRSLLLVVDKKTIFSLYTFFLKISMV